MGYSQLVKLFAATATNFINSSKVRRTLQVVAVVTILFFFGLAFYSLKDDLLAYPWQLDPLYASLSLLVLVARGPVGAYAWWAIMRQLGHRLPWWRTVKMVYHSTLAGFVPGPALHAFSRAFMAEREGVPKTLTLVSVGMESVLNMLAALVVASLTLLAWPDAPILLGVGVFVALLALLSRPQLWFRTLNWLLVRLKRRPVEVTMSGWDSLRLTWPYILNWTLFGVQSYMLLAAIYPQMSLSYLPAVTGLYSAAWLAGYMAVFVPQGYGVREVFIVGVLTGVTGVPVAVALAAAILSRLWSMLGVAVWAAISARA